MINLGELFVFKVTAPIGIFWLAVRFHPDDPNLVLLVPADDFFMFGGNDLVVMPPIEGMPLTVRCGHSIWIPVETTHWIPCKQKVSEETLKEVKFKIAHLARGIAVENEDDNDPNYQSHLKEIAQSCAEVQKQTNG